MEIIILLFWFLSGIFAAALAHDKNIGYLTGCLSGFLLGPIGLLIIALMQKREKPVKEKDK